MDITRKWLLWLESHITQRKNVLRSISSHSQDIIARVTKGNIWDPTIHHIPTNIISVCRYPVLNWSRKINQETLLIFQTAVDENDSAGPIYPSCRDCTSPRDLKFFKNSPIFCFLSVIKVTCFSYHHPFYPLIYVALLCIKYFILFFFSLLHWIITCLKWKSWNIHSVPLHRCC